MPSIICGQTICHFRRRVLEHLNNVILKKDKPIARHVWHKHRKPKSLNFCVIQQICLGQRKGDLNKHCLSVRQSGYFALDHYHLMV